MCILVIIFYASGQRTTMFWKFTRVSVTFAFMMYLKYSYSTVSCFGYHRAVYLFCFCDYDNIRASLKSFICLSSRALYKRYLHKHYMHYIICSIVCKSNKNTSSVE